MDDLEILILNGASSSGKTTLCKQLQEVFDEPYMHLEEDRFVFNTYHDRFVSGELAPQLFQKTMLGYYRSLAAFLSAGHRVLADTGFYSAELLGHCLEELKPYRVWLIGVHCAPAELERRERARADRQPGLALEQYATIHAFAGYDIEVDTSAADVAACAVQIKQQIVALGSPKAASQLRQRLVARAAR